MDYGKKYGTISSTPHVGDAVVYNYNGSDYADHVALVTAVSGGSVTITGGNQGGRPGHVSTNSTSSYSVGSAPWGQRISGYVSFVAATPPRSPTRPPCPPERW